jgi:tetratricopeptide (TPR) repeat protein
MPPELRPELQTALDLFRRGRFSDTVEKLSRLVERGRPVRRHDVPTEALLADALQLIGRNRDAQAIASRRLHETSDNHARFHLVLGNVCRARGQISRAIEHLQMAAAALPDPELSCWVQLRLMAAIGEMSGREAAITRLDDVTRTLTKYGDARPFAALHLWFVETDTMRGDLQSARRHLKTADSLLSQVDDVWLRGYLAINSSVVYYYHAEIEDARKWAETAITCARESGHRTTKRAAYANLGYFEFATGEFLKAEEHFQIALESCEQGSVNEIAILER